MQYVDEGVSSFNDTTILRDLEAELLNIVCNDV